MSIVVEDFLEKHVDAVARFNRRLSASAGAVLFPESSISSWLPKDSNRRLFREHFVAVDESAEVRGAYMLKHQDFWLADKSIAIGNFTLPISEGLVNRKYSQVAALLLRDALKRQPLLFSLGIGGFDVALAKLLDAARWRMFAVPFHFRVIHPAAFLRNIVHLRQTAMRRRVLDSLAATGLGWLGIRATQFFRGGRPASSNGGITLEMVDEFGSWADDVWDACKSQYRFSAIRDADNLRILYPRENEKFIRLKVSNGGRPIGWAVLLDTQCSGHLHFGTMRLGSIVDCLAGLGDADKVVAAARQCLESRGVDLIISNQSHSAWCDAFRQSGFLRGPSNFLFAASRDLSAVMQENTIGDNNIHFNRGDGDGPIHL